MKKTENCVNAKINHIHFHGDCLVFEFAKSKVHKKGENHIGPWNIHANPFKNVVVSSAIIIVVFLYPGVLKGYVPLSEGKSQCAQYATRFTKLVKQLKTWL